MTENGESPVDEGDDSTLSSDRSSPVPPSINISPVILKLKAACEWSSTSSVNLLEQNIKDCCTSLNDPSVHPNNLVLCLLNSDSFNDSLDTLCLQACPQEFSDRDYFSYDRSDFEGQCDKAKCVFEFLIKLLSGLDSSDKELNPSSQETSNAVIDGCANDKKYPDRAIHQNLSGRLPRLMLMVAGNANGPIWSSTQCQGLSLQLIHLVLRLYRQDTIAGLLEVNICGNKKNRDSLKSSEKTLLSHLLHDFELHLTRERWEKNPFLCEAFFWLARQLSSAQTSLCLTQILAVSLNFLHHFDSNYKLKGLHLFNHLINSVSNEELRWYNRAEVLYEALKSQMYCKEDIIVDAVIDCLCSVVKVVEKAGGTMSRHHFVLATLLTLAESENLVSLRRIYISHLEQFVPHCGAICIGHLGDILKVIECYLEVDDGPKEEARSSALDVLENVLRVAWPRTSFHAEAVLKFLLKFVININSPSSVKTGGPGSAVKGELEGKVIKCLDVLGKTNPDVYRCLEALKMSRHQGYLDSFLETLPVSHAV